MGSPTTSLSRGVDADQAGYHLYENSSLESYRLQRTYEDRTTWIEDE